MAKNYKDTILLPRTDFPMKANLPVRENEVLRFWRDNNVYTKILEKRKGSEKFVLHDGPPYANGNIHMGHALNKVLKDIIVKYKLLKGYFSPFLPGWDCHGLPIELKVEEKLGKSGRKDIIQFRKKCREYAEKYINIQREEFIRLGVFGLWEKPYMTMDYRYEAHILREFSRMVEKGFVYRRKKPVYWCPSCTTALAEAEVEYAEKTSPSVYVAFPADWDLREKFSLPEQSYVVIWTTTPWTIPGNLGIQVGPEFDYVWVETDVGTLLVAEKRLNDFAQGAGVNAKKVIRKVKGEELEGLHAIHPIFDRKSLIMLSEYVTLDQGTGCVHTAPGHGEEDYEIGLRYGLEVFSPVDEEGKFTDEAGEFKGEFVFSANKHVNEVLRSKGLLLAEGEITHSYPHCWRCKKAIIFRATEQWFISVEHENLREKLLDEINRVKWIPAWGENRIRSMAESRPDWCVSRQRAWGVPIAFFRCKKCGAYIQDRDTLGEIADLFEKKGADAWYTDEAFQAVSGKKCPSCGSGEFTQEKDILDVWFDSGVSHSAVLMGNQNLSWPADLYLEGSDQHRGWFQSSLITAVITRGKAPYRQVLTHGFVVDGDGRKMSKSLGNVISPQEIIKKYGAEIIRLWVAYEDYREDVRLSHEILERLVESYRKIRNTFRFMLGNLHDFTPSEKVPEGELSPVDLFAIYRFRDLLKKIENAYEKYEFHTVFHNYYNFVVSFLSAFYLDVLKDTLYCEAPSSRKRRSAQTAIYEILKNMLIVFSPVLSFTCEEAWQELRKIDPGLSESVFEEAFPKPGESDERVKVIAQEFETLLKVREDVLKKLEEKRVAGEIGSSLEAKVIVKAPDKLIPLLEKYRDTLREIFITSGVEFMPLEKGLSPEGATVTVYVEKAEGEKCERCWNYSPTVGKFEEHPGVCERCYKVVSGG